MVMVVPQSYAEFKIRNRRLLDFDSSASLEGWRSSVHREFLRASTQTADNRLLACRMPTASVRVLLG